MGVPGGSKRAIDLVDLTGDDDYQIPTKTPRRSTGRYCSSSDQVSSNRCDSSSEAPSASSTHFSSSSPYQTTTQVQRNSWQQPSTQLLRDDANADIVTDEFDDAAYQQFELYGTLSTKIVGIRYYNGDATAGEFCIARREPGNPYDRNAIRIDNVMGQQIGHIGRKIAEKVAALIDSGEIVVEGQLTGEKGTFDMPIGLKLFGSGDAVQQLATRQKFDELRLPLDHLKREERGRKQEERERAKAEKERQKENVKRINREEAAKKAMRDSGYCMPESKMGFAGAPPVAGDGDGPSMEDILANSTTFDPRRLDGLVNQFSISEEQLSLLPMAIQPSAIKTTLLPYQRRGLAWLLEHENPTLPAAGTGDTVQLWRRGRHSGFTNIATNYSQPTPKLASGGILADDTGLGKTLQIISLIVADPNRTRQATLIVSPLGVMSNWAQQIEAHTDDDQKMKVLTYHGNNRKEQKEADFQEYDVVITTYETLAIEYLPYLGAKPKPVPRPRGLFSAHWRRVVLDEGHNIRNAKSKKAQAAFAVAGLSMSKWVLTGTPIVNNLNDLQSLIRFVGLTGGLEAQEVFSAQLVRPLNQGQPEAQYLLQTLIASICLRRMKDMKFIDLKLPEMTSHQCNVSWKKSEREKYDAVLAQAKGMLQQVTQRSNNNSNSEPAGATYSHLLEVLLRLRQVCNHWTLCKDRVTGLMDSLAPHKPVNLTPENTKALQSLLQLSIDNQEECPICFETLHSPVITTCAHVYGQECIERVIQTQQKCPLCRSALADNLALVQPAEESSDDENLGEADDVTTPSSKIEALLNILTETSRREPTRKTVVFSQWTSFLDLLEPFLDAAGLTYCRLDGKMNATTRDVNVHALNTDAECTIMLASLSVCSVGLNLVAASQVVMCDSWWSPAIEDQAVDRVHRLGQTREVRVWRLVMEESVEERVLEVQGDKRKLVGAAFGERKKKGVGVGRVQDIQRLLS